MPYQPTPSEIPHQELVALIYGDDKGTIYIEFLDGSKPCLVNLMRVSLHCHTLSARWEVVRGKH